MVCWVNRSECDAFFEGELIHMRAPLKWIDAQGEGLAVEIVSAFWSQIKYCLKSRDFIGSFYTDFINGILQMFS